MSGRITGGSRQNSSENIELDGMDMHGYLRTDGQIGIRNSIAVIYTDREARHAAKQIGRGIPRAEVFGISDQYKTDSADMVLALCRHPNFAAIVIVGMDEEDGLAGLLAEEAAHTSKPAALIHILTDGGSIKAVYKGIRIGCLLARQADDGQKIPISLANLLIGVCYEMDGDSASQALPATEWLVNWIAGRSGTVICCGLPEVSFTSTLAAGQKPLKPGLYRMEQKGFNGLLAAGVHIIVLVSAKGRVTGSIAVPVIKVCANSEVYRLLSDDMDIDAGQTADTAMELGRHILGRLVDIASGEPSKAEILRHYEFYR